ncbi:MAG: hypothetical protein IKV55_02475, partial [Oscillospiraceae bacterium]|nr:hypothetical protein [Oscillospiraceae bacterium]
TIRKIMGKLVLRNGFLPRKTADFALALRVKLPQPLYVALCVIWYCLTLSPIFMQSMAAAIVCLSRCKKADELLLFALGAGAEAFVMINLLKQGGSSELYFISGIYPIIFLIGLHAVNRIREEKPAGKHAAGVAAALLVLCLFFDAKTSLGYYSGAAEWKNRFYLSANSREEMDEITRYFYSNAKAYDANGNNILIPYILPCDQ